MVKVTGMLCRLRSNFREGFFLNAFWLRLVANFADVSALAMAGYLYIVRSYTHDTHNITHPPPPPAPPPPSTEAVLTAALQIPSKAKRRSSPVAAEHSMYPSARISCAAR